MDQRLLVVLAILPFFSTTIGGITALRAQHRLHPLMAVAAGMVIATALSDLLPEAMHRQPGVGLSLVLAAACGAAFILIIQSQIG